ncbi:hypothetical protein CcCBS67573_g01257 [Chytriomyces confervae]|uniref:Mannosyltransferase n=1 Tax=Chytriomyces confervae TaxID=246404 RepID=A0A507FLZ9_9FUNG|nr:hypothetical protein HDU80_000965 [Chytriomyces hyalinus]TPX77451.1 hypothetical protein CcCBS67573_g01257 [Chytriomyces confervae]
MKLPRRIRLIIVLIAFTTAGLYLLYSSRNVAFRRRRLDFLQSRFLDFLNGETHNTRGQFGGSLDRSFDPAKTFHLIVSEVYDTVASEYNRSNIHELGRRARTNLLAYSLLHEKQSVVDQLTRTEAEQASLRTHLNVIVEESTHVLYPWITTKYKSIRDAQKSFLNAKDEYGIVFTSGQWHFEFCLNAILALRKVLNCTLPIEVHYAGPDDLTEEMTRAFNSLDNVRTVDVWDYFGEEGRNISGWAIKPFAILASRFRKVLFIDADGLFFQNPDKLLQTSKIFTEFGSLFYSDRTLGRGDAHFFKQINPVWTHYASTLRYMTKKSLFEMESGVVAVDKGRAGPLHALMLVCKMNSRPERDLMYNYVHGDKETFWFAWDILRVPYKFSPTFGGAAGYLNAEKQVCGGIFHVDEELQPLWFNGGVVVNKHVNKDQQYIDFQYVAYDELGSHVKWIWETDDTPFCVVTKNMPHVKVTELTVHQKGYAAQYVQMYKSISEKGWREYFKSDLKIKL